MHVESLSCNNCGAPLDVSPNTNYATCAHCSSRLAIHRTGSAAYTQVLADVKADTSKILRRTDSLLEQSREFTGEMRRQRLEKELKELDDAWHKSRDVWISKFPSGTNGVPQVRQLRTTLRVWSAVLVISVAGFIAGTLLTHNIGDFANIVQDIAFVGVLVGLLRIQITRESLDLSTRFSTDLDEMKEQRDAIIEQINDIQSNSQASRAKRVAVRKDSQ